MEAAEAFAFRQMVAHLRDNSPAVQNMAMMTTAGFCRNCLAKWLLAGARRSGDAQLSYDGACELVYGVPYSEWKRQFQAKASPEQLLAYEASQGLHAQHPDLDKLPVGLVLSDVCCQPAGEGDANAEAMAARVADLTLHSDGDVVPLPPVSVRLGVLTVSDRASRGEYADLSGPEVRDGVHAFAARSGGRLALARDTDIVVVPDDFEQIAAAIRQLASRCNLVITTGGTGLAPRDVTPEATLSVLQREVRGISEVIRRETSRVEPLAMLSRAVAGVVRSSGSGGFDALVVNLPGRPKAVRESLAVLLPALPHAMAQLGT